MAIKLFVTDMDGTLLNNHHEISDGNQRAIRKAVEDGMVFTIATGRMHKSTVSFAQILGIEVPIITYNGALICTTSGKELYSNCVKPELISDIIDCADELGQYIQIATKTDLYYKEHCSYSDFYEAKTKTPGYAVGEKLKEYTKDVAKLLIIADSPASVPGIIARFKERFGDKLTVVASTDTFIEIIDPATSKANAMLKLADILGIEQKDVLAIGDAGNDIPMIKAAGVGVAMGNAIPEVKAVADYEVKSNEEDGLAEAIDRFFYEKQ